MRKALKAFILLLFLLLFYQGRLYATHIVGGDLTYRHLHTDSFEITLVLYIDCINGSAAAIREDSIAMIGVFDSSGVLLKQLLSRRSLPVRVNSVNYDCVIPPSNACVDQYIYKYYTTLPYRTGGYVLDFQRCCRNNTISNLVSPGNTGATYWNYVPDSVWGLGKNNSAVFKSLPPNFLCAGRDFVFDHSATDADGDSLVYELYTPYLGADINVPLPRPPDGPPFRNIVWAPDFGVGKMMNGVPELSIDPATGRLTVRPRLTGQFVVGIAVKEFRNGKNINTTRRDFQFNVFNCQFTVVSAFAKDIRLCSDTVKFVNASTGADQYLWNFGDSTTTSDTSSLFEPTYIFPHTGTYRTRLLVKKGNCSDSVTANVTIDLDIGHFAANDTAVCHGASLRIGSTQSEGFSYEWTPATYLDDPHSNNPLCTPRSSIVYTVTRKTDFCTNTDQVKVDTKGIRSAFSYTTEQGCEDAELRMDSFPQADYRLWRLNGDSISLEALQGRKIRFNDSVRVALIVSDSVCTDSLEKNFVITFNDSLEHIPNVFTPDDDGMNDCYRIRNVSLGTACGHILIYNRWGGLVFDSDKDGSCWNGKVNGQNATSGVYYYILHHGPRDYHGTITLIR